MFPKLLRRDIALLLCIKVAALILLYQLFVAPMAKPEPSGSDVRAHFIGRGE
jgi:hypothetical protein